MSSEIIDFSDENISFLLPSNDILKGSGADSRWQKTLDLVKDSLETRLDIVKQRKDKNQQYIQDQITKLDSKENEYLKKYQETEKNVSDTKLKLKHIEYSFFDVQKKLSAEKEINQQLQERIAALRLEKDNVNEQVKKTWKVFLTVLNWYKEYLHIHIQLDKENPKLCTFSFGPNQKSLNNQLFVKFEILDENKFKLLDIHPPVPCEKENIGKTHTEYQITSFLYSIRKAFLSLKAKE